MTDDQVSDGAYVWMKEHSNVLIQTIAGKYADNKSGRVAVFMAGAPGAGKTEFSICLIRDVFGQNTTLIVRIDPDEIRLQLPMYIEGEAELFNRATIKDVEILVDHCFDKNITKAFYLMGL